MWNKDRSLLLSIYSIRVLFAFWIVMVVFGYPIVKAYVDYNAQPSAFYVILITLYLCLAIVIFLIKELYRLLLNIKDNHVFVSDNVVCLRRISWLCFAIGIVTFIATLGYVTFILVAITFTFITFIVRVVKNVMEEAIAIKEENDYTI